MACEKPPVAVALPASTPLHSAAEAGDAAAVVVLIRNGQAANSRAEWPNYENGATALHLAAQRGYLEVVLALLSAGAEPKGCETTSTDWDADLTPLHEASARGHVEVVRALLSAGERSDSVASGRKVGDLRVGSHGREVFSEWDGGHTPLHLASAFGHVNVVRALVESGASVHARSGDNDDTPLHLAASGGRLGAMAVLVEAGADVDAGDNSGNTALHVAADASSTEFLLAAGANPNLVAQSPYGTCTPLGSYCALIHRLETTEEGVENATLQVKILLSNGADARLQASRNDSQGGKSPIISCAAKNGVPGILSALLGAGADPGERDQEGWAPLHDAARGDHVEVVRLLLRAGASIEARTVREGWTPLHVACRFTSVACVRELLKWGGDLSARGYDPHDDAWLGYQPFDARRLGVSKRSGETPVEVIGLRHRAAAPPVKGGSADSSQDEDEQMEVFDEDTGEPDTGASARNAIRRALRREESWRRRRGVILFKASFDRQFATASSPAEGAATGVKSLDPARSVVSDTEEGGWHVSVRHLEQGAARVQCGGAKRRRRTVGGEEKDGASLLSLLTRVTDLARCEELFRHIVLLL